MFQNILGKMQLQRKMLVLQVLFFHKIWDLGNAGSPREAGLAAIHAATGVSLLPLHLDSSFHVFYFWRKSIIYFQGKQETFFLSIEPGE